MTWEIVTKGLCDHYYQNNKMRKNINLCNPFNHDLRCSSLSVVLTLFSKGKEGKIGRSGGHVWKCFKDYNSGLIPYGSLRSWLELRNFLANGERLQKPEHCDQELWNLIMQVRFYVFLSWLLTLQLFLREFRYAWKFQALEQQISHNQKYEENCFFYQYCKHNRLQARHILKRTSNNSTHLFSPGKI